MCTCAGHHAGHGLGEQRRRRGSCSPRATSRSETMPSTRRPSEETTSAPMPLVGEHAEGGAHALRPVDGGDLAALVAQQLADLHRNLLTDPCAERCGECPPAARRATANGARGDSRRPTVEGCARSDRTRCSGSGTPWAAGSPARSRPGCWPTRPAAPGSCRHLLRAVVQMLPLVVALPASSARCRWPTGCRRPSAGSLHRPDVLDGVHDRDDRAPRAQGRLSARAPPPGCGRSGPSASGSSAARPTARAARAASTEADSVDAEAELDRHLEVGDVAVDDLTADLLGLEPLDVPHGLRRPCGSPSGSRRRRWSRCCRRSR